MAGNLTNGIVNGMAAYEKDLGSKEYAIGYDKIDWTNNKKDNREAETLSEPAVILNI